MDFGKTYAWKISWRYVLYMEWDKTKEIHQKSEHKRLKIQSMYLPDSTANDE